jgi:DHA1 family bicyclomycin/chloramphenicol resistance-like MFS transporter
VPVLSSKRCMLFVASVTLFIIPYWIFIGMAPILYMEDLGVPLSQFGVYQGAMAGMYAILSFTSGVFIKRFGPKNCMCFSILLYVITAFLLTFLSVVEVGNPVIITAVAAMSGLALVFPITILCHCLWRQLMEPKQELVECLMQ